MSISLLLRAAFILITIACTESAASPQSADDLVAELVAADVDALPEGRRAEQEGVGRGAEALEEDSVRRALAATRGSGDSIAARYDS